MVSPLCSPVTYEGLIDEVFGITCGVVEFDKDVTGSDKAVKVALNNKDEVFRSIYQSSNPPISHARTAKD